MSVHHTIHPNKKDLGDGFVVRRSLPHDTQKMVGPFVFWDHMGPAEMGGDRRLKVRAHPHIGLATITYLFEGEIVHRDSLGNEQVILPGEVNWMTAGRGIVHSERSPDRDRLGVLEGIQLWLALPTEFENVEPSFVHHKEKDLPLITKEGLTLRLVAGTALGQKSPVPVYSDLFYLTGQANAATDFTFDLEPSQEGAIYIIDGEVEVEGQAQGRFTLVTFKKGTRVQFKTLAKTKFMLFGGAVFPEKRTVWWNFVASDRALIEAAKNRWRKGDFPSVYNESESIPLPESP